MNSKEAIEIFLAGVSAALPVNIIPVFFKQNKQIYEDIMRVKANGHKIFVLSLGKAGYSLAQAFAEVLTPDDCFVITKTGHLPKRPESLKYPTWIFYEGTHPLPSKNNEIYTRKLTRIYLVVFRR